MRRPHPLTPRCHSEQFYQRGHQADGAAQDPLPASPPESPFPFLWSEDEQSKSKRSTFRNEPGGRGKTSNNSSEASTWINVAVACQPRDWGSHDVCFLLRNHVPKLFLIRFISNTLTPRQFPPNAKGSPRWGCVLEPMKCVVGMRIPLKMYMRGGLRWAVTTYGRY